MSQEPIKKSEAAEREEQILKFWQENKIFEKTLQKPSPKGEFVFYDGPPFATGLPHYGHMLAGTMKDVIPRYKTMNGYHVNRVWGWDCHGLPIENLVEKELGLETKKDIEKYGIDKFNKAARESVLRYDAEWKKFVPRFGRWVDMDTPYKTMDSKYTESVWWSWKELTQKNLVYEGFKVMPYCPHCGTTLSNFEVNQGYKDISDISVYVKFKIKKFPNSYFVAWTTTPWTLPGNTALAVGAEIEYVEVEVKDQVLVLAKEKLSLIKEEYKILATHKGSEMVGMEYEPVFNYFESQDIKNKENGWRVVAGDFVTTEDGTGIVHIAPAFGGDDYELSQKENLPIIVHVDLEGKMKPEIKDFAGMLVKPKSNDEKERLATDISIIRYLQDRGSFFDKEKIKHSYPHCWRCDTPLLNYATSSWFIKVTDLKDKMLSLNSKVSWVPSDIGENRFGKWIEGARDWAVSRSRYWGAPIPVWKCNSCKAVETLGSFEELKNKIHKSGNKYFTIRHGEAEQNIKDLINSELSNNIYHLTEEGRKRVLEASENIKKEKIDFIITSPFLRCKETAEIVRGALGLDASCVQEDERLAEFKKGPGFEGKSWQEYWGLFSSTKERFEKSPDGGENLTDLNKRAGEFIYDLEKRYSGKNILIVSHQGPIASMHMIAEGADAGRFIEAKEKQIYTFGFADFRKLDFAPLPHNENYELDVHRPFIDEVRWSCECGGEFERIKEVFDTWYDSGSMPYASVHHPFESEETFLGKKKFPFPADFIAEGLDQTRGWFYTLLVLGAGIFSKSPYDNVIVNGIVLAEDGQKMSKKLKNYPDPMDMVNKYGADTIRYYMTASPVVRAEDLAFSEKGLDEVSKKLIKRLGNVCEFYLMYGDSSVTANNESPKIIDRWIISRLSQAGKDIDMYLSKYELEKAARPVMDFVEDLSTWYLRRSRDRFKAEDQEEKKFALATMRFILLELSKYMAPFTPFFAEDLYRSVRGDKETQSVHLCDWPEDVKIEKDVLEGMKEVRRLVSVALEKRNVAGVKVRQPLQKVTLKNLKFEGKKEYIDLIRDEVNVKEVLFNENLEEEIELDTLITEGLKKEGMERDIIRLIQELRKTSNLNPSDSKNLLVDTDENGKRFLEDAAERIKTPTNINSFIFEANDGQENLIENMKFKFKIS